MPISGETVTHVCNGAWEAVAGPGRADLLNRDNSPTNRTLRYALGRQAPSDPETGFILPVQSDNRFDVVAVMVPAGTTLWIRGGSGQRVTLFVETAAS
jgi:hypothetical protein